MYSIVLMMALSGGAEAPAWHGCHGSNGCHASHAGCHGGHHRSHGCCGHHREHGCHARHRGHGCHGGCHGYAGNGYSSYGCHGDYMGPVHEGWHDGAPMPPPPQKGEQLKAPPKPATEEAFVPAPARIIVNLPADARLTIDGYVTTSTATTRVFASPSLEAGKQFYYMFEGELVRDGRTVTTSKKVEVRAGEQIQVQLDFPL